MIPYHSDAPLYHWPIATGLLIGVSCLLFVLVPHKYLESQPQPRVPFAVGGAGQPAGDAGLPDELEQDANWDADAFRIVEQPQGNDQARGAPIDAPLAVQPAEPVEPSPRKPARAAATPITLALEHGVGLKPWQWLTSLFLHDSLWQLLMNMVVLWAFGMVVEGKVGGLVFLGIYLGIGMAQGAIEQLLTMLAPQSASLGPNAALLGLLGIAVIWAPRNEFDVLWGWGMRISSIEVPILLYGFVQFALELLGIAFGQWGVSTSVLHMLGLLLGLCVGWVWLRRGWVDCEGWDLIHVWRGKEATPEDDRQVADEARQLVRSTARGLRSPAPAAKPVSESFRERLSSDRGLADVEQLIADGNLATALKLLNKLRVTQPALQLSHKALHQLIQRLLKDRQFADAIPFMREHISRFEEQRAALQLNTAKLLLHLQRPRQALEILRSMQPPSLDSTQRETRQTLAHHAQHQIDEGTIELSES